jgi:hypothetical protein
MKYLTIILFALIAACAPANPTVPANSTRCSSDNDCPRGYYCGFVAVDTVPVCKEDHNMSGTPDWR